MSENGYTTPDQLLGMVPTDTVTRENEKLGLKVKVRQYTAAEFADIMQAMFTRDGKPRKDQQWIMRRETIAAALVEPKLTRDQLERLARLEAPVVNWLYEVCAAESEQASVVDMAKN